MIMKPAIIKAELLSNGVSFERGYFKKKVSSYEFYANQYVYNKTSEGIDKSDIIPQGLCLESNVFCSLLRRNDSIITLERINNTDYLIKNGNILGKFNFQKSPNILV